VITLISVGPSAGESIVIRKFVNVYVFCVTAYTVVAFVVKAGDVG
jgi:hypothetical protein